jgi:hypothetical protein
VFLIEWMPPTHPDECSDVLYILSSFIYNGSELDRTEIVAEGAPSLKSDSAQDWIGAL